MAYGTLGRSGAPFGGRTGALGTNPISIGFPAEGDEPFVLDFATTAVAGGKVMVARDKHEQLPPNSAMDRDGRPTTDPNALSQGGALLPFGGHKGYALSVMAVLLSSVLVREPDEASGGGQSGGREGGGGARVFFCAIDSAVFGAGAPAAAAQRLRQQLREVPPAEGFQSVQVPGEPERRSRERRLEGGIPVAEDTWKAIAGAGAGLGVSI